MFCVLNLGKDDIREAFVEQFLHNIKELVLVTLPLSD